MNNRINHIYSSIRCMNREIAHIRKHGFIWCNFKIELIWCAKTNNKNNCFEKSISACWVLAGIYGAGCYANISLG